MPGRIKKQIGASEQFCRFGDFEVDLVSAELRKRGIKLKLSGQPFEVLRLLVRRPDELVTREELRSQIWTTDTFVDFEHGLNAAVNKLRETLGDSASHPRYIETLHRRGYRFVTPVKTGRAHDTSQSIRSIAVLPLENSSRNAEEDYFVDGMTEALVTDLAKIGSLRVISLSSVMIRKRLRKPLADFARELNVEGIVEGTVRRVGNRVRITVRLVHALSNTHLWSERYERDLSDVFALQNEVASAIAGEIRIKVGPQEQVLDRTNSVSPAAYEIYLKGRFYWNKRTPDSVSKSIEYFQQTVQIAPRYALAWAALADAYVMLGSMALEVVPPHEAMPKARVAAQKALEIDDSLGEANATLAYISAAYDYDWTAARIGFERAVTLSPGYATAHHWFAVVLSRLGDLDQAQSEIGKAHDLDPLSLQINSEMAAMFYLQRKNAKAVEQGLKTLELDPTFPTAHVYLSLTYLQEKKFAEALSHAKNAAGTWGDSASSLGLMAGCYAASRKKSEAKKIIDQLRTFSKRQYVSAFAFAWVYALLHDKEAAMAHLEQAYLERSSYLMLLKMEPSLDFLRSDLRFQNLLRRVGLDHQ